MSPTHTPLAPETLDRLRQVSTPTLTTQLFKLGFRNVFLHGVRPVCADSRLVGEAVTVRFAPAREDLATFEILGNPAYPQRHAIEHIAAGTTGVLLGLQGAAIATTPLDEVVATPRKLDLALLDLARVLAR